MTTSYTKGIWRTSLDCCYVTTSKIGFLDSSKEICKISEFSKTDEEITANAKLIAAAPEMLEVLETIENDANQIPEWLLLRIKNVIKKATE